MKDSNPYLVPGSIIVAGLLLALAIYFSGGTTTTSKSNNPNATSQHPESPNIKIESVDQSDHIRGSFDAPVKIVEFSDLECPFCQKIHGTLQQVVDEYDGQVAWIYRHAPLASLHSKAQREAEASECAAELGGNDIFWAYIDRIFEITPANNGLLDSQLPEVAEFVGIDVSEFNSCLESGKYADKVKAQLEDAFNAGLQGTPHSVVIAPNGELFPIIGAQSYETIKVVVDNALDN